MIGPGFVEKGVNTMMLATTGDGEERRGMRTANRNVYNFGLACEGSNLRFVPMKVEFCSSLCGPGLRR